MGKFEWVCDKCGECCRSFGNENGITIFQDELHLFKPRDIRVSMAGGFGFEKKEAMTYQMIRQPCPHYDKNIGCKVNEMKPLFCRTYPLVIDRFEGDGAVFTLGKCHSAEVFIKENLPEKIRGNVFQGKVQDIGLKRELESEAEMGAKIARLMVSAAEERRQIYQYSFLDGKWRWIALDSEGARRLIAHKTAARKGLKRH